MQQAHQKSTGKGVALDRRVREKSLRETWALGRIAETNQLTFSTLELVNLVWYRSLCRSFLICMMEVLMFISKQLQVITEKTG